MSYHQNVFAELTNVKKHFKKLIDINNFETINEIISLMHVFGETINSSTLESIKEMKLQSLNVPDLYDEYFFKIYNNLLILMEEYNQIILNQNVNGISKQFKVNNSELVLVIDENKNTHFFEEKEKTIEVVTNQLSKDTEAIIFIGLGSSEIIEHLNNEYKVLVVEPYENQSNTKAEQIIYAKETDFSNKLNEKLLELIGLKTEVVIHPLYPFTTHVIEIMQEVRNLLQKMQLDWNTRVLHTQEWYVQYFLNAQFLEKSSSKIINIDLLNNFHKGERGLMIAGGPSLEEALPYLRKAQHCYYIVAIGQTVKVLKDNDITPDYVVSLDSQTLNSHFFKDVVIECPLIFPLQVNHEIPKRTEGILVPYPNNEITKNILSYSHNYYSTAPTVAISAVMFMNFMGFSSIGLIGQDLALKDGEYYSSSVKKVSATNGQFSEKLYEVILNSGEIGKTTPVLANFLSNYEILLKNEPELLSKMQNYAKDGAKISSIPLSSLNSLSNDVIIKKKLQLNSSNHLSNTIKVADTYKIMERIKDELLVISSKIKRISNQRAVTLKEFDVGLKAWDCMLEIGDFKTFVMPLQVVKMLIIQNKIQLHDHLNQNSEKRIEILKLMYDTVESFINQIDLISKTKKSNY